MNENLNQLVILVFGGAGLITLPIIYIGMYLEWKCNHKDVTVDWGSPRFKTRCNKCGAHWLAYYDWEANYGKKQSEVNKHE